jgi:hypothetical protein
MKPKTFGHAFDIAIALVGLLGACSSNNGTAPAGGSGGSGQGGGTGGHTTSSGGNSGTGGGQGGQSTATGGGAGGGGLGGQTTGTGGSTGGVTGSGGQGGRVTSTGGGSTGGVGGAGGSDMRTDAAAGAGGGGQGGGGQGGTSVPRADAADTSPGGAGGTDAADAGGASGSDATDAPAVGNPRRVLLCDEGNRRVLLVDLQNPSAAVWSTSLGDTNTFGDGMRDMQLVGSGRVAVSVAKGYVELDLATGAIKKQVTKFTGVESLRRLPSGNTVLGGNSDGGVTLQELDIQDAAVSGHKVTFTNFSQFRMMRRTPQDTFLIGAANTLAEVNWNKQTVWQMDFPAAAGHDPNYIYQGLRLPDNTIAVTTGYGVTVSVVDPAAKKVVTAIGGQGQPNATTIAPYFYAGFQVLPNGHFVVTNWEGHGGGNGGKGIQLLEYDASGALVWKWKQDASLVSSLHNVIVLDGLDTSKLHDDVNGVLAPVTP